MPDYSMLVREVVELRAGLRRLEAAEPPINVAAGKTLKVKHSMTLTGADGRTLTIPATGTAALLGTAQTFNNTQTIDGNVNELLFLKSSSAGFGRLTIANNVQTIIDFNNYTSNTIRARFQFVETGARFIIRNNTASGPMEFLTTTAGGTLTEAMRLTATQRLLIGTTTDNAQLSVNQSSATGAVPTLRLRQADLSEEMIRFDTTVGTGNPVNTTALGAYYGRVRVWVEGVGAKWLALYD